MKNAVHDGKTMPWTNGTGGTVAGGTLVKIANTLGVLINTTPNGGVGTLAIEGVFSGMPKVSAAVFAAGEKLLWDVSASKFDDSAATPASGDVMGAAVAFVAGANDETTCTIKLTPGNSTVT